MRFEDLIRNRQNVGFFDPLLRAQGWGLRALGFQAQNPTYTPATPDIPRYNPAQYWQSNPSNMTVDALMQRYVLPTPSFQSMPYMQQPHIPAAPFLQTLQMPTTKPADYSRGLL